MPPKKTKKKGMKVVMASDLTSFNNQELKKQQEKDFAQQPQQQNEKSASHSKASAQSSSQVEVNRCEEEVTKFQPEDFNIPAYYSMDNKLIDAYYTRIENFSEDEKDLLDDSEFLHFIRQINRELDYILSLKFSHFWGLLTKVPDIQRFLDDFLQNVRKHNDIYKIQFLEISTIATQQQQRMDASVNQKIKEAINKLLQLVLRILYRMSLTIESEDAYFSLQFYQKIVYDNWMYDMAKLIDLAAVYGRSNGETVKTIINNVFENDKRFVQDFKECIDSLVNLIKKTFKSYHKIQLMIKGEDIREHTHQELQQFILKYLTDYAEILSNFALLTSTFPESVLETLRSTNSMLYLANAYCLTLQMKKDLVNQLHIYIPKVNDRDTSVKKMEGYAFATEIQTIKKLCVQSCVSILNRVLLNNINRHTQNYAVVQHAIAQTIRQFVMCVTGNNEVSKDVIPKQTNFMAIDNDKESVGISFLKRILKLVDLLDSIESIEERFLPDGEKQFLTIVVDSLQKGQKVQVQKIRAIQQAANHGSNQNNSNSQQEVKKNLQDKENINSLFEMCGQQHKKELIEQLYLRNDKNFEKTLDQILSGNIPKDEYKVVVINQNSEQIDTFKQKPKQSELLQSYMLGSFQGSKARATKNQRYYQDHLKMLDSQKQADDQEDKELKLKMLHLADMMQYEDDFDDQNFYQDNARNRKKGNVQGGQSDSDQESKPKTILQKGSDKKQQQQMDDDDDMDEDVMERLLEGEELDEDNQYMFQDDEKVVKRKQQQVEEQQKRQQEQLNQKKEKGGQSSGQGGGQMEQKRGNGGQGYQQQQRQPQQYEERKPQYVQKFVPKGSQQQQQPQKPQDHDQSDTSSYRGGNRDPYQNNQRGGYQRGGNYRGGGGGGGTRGSRGGQGRGYRDDYQREGEERDNYYTSSNPLAGHDLENNYEQRNQPSQPQPQYQPRFDDQNEDSEEGESSNMGRGQRGGRGRGGGRGSKATNRGGYHDQKSKNQKKQGAYYPA